MEDTRLERIRVTVYQDGNWEKFPDDTKIEFEGLFLGYKDQKRERLEVIADSGRKKLAYVKFTKFHIDTIFKLKPTQEDPLDFRGKRAIYTETDGEEFPVTFIKFAGSNGAIVLNDDGKLWEVHVNFLTIEKEEEVKKSDDPIKNRLESI